MASIASEFDSRNSEISDSDSDSEIVVVAVWVSGSAMAGHCWNLEITAAAAAANTMVRAVSLRVCVMGLLLLCLVAAETTVVVVLMVGCLKGLRRGLMFEGFESGWWNVSERADSIDAEWRFLV
ncbi:hypothetical protein Hanom_Chr11g00973621 [Helianthus anomalus]